MPCSNDKLAKVAIMSAYVVLHDLINDVGMKSSGEHLKDTAVITFKASTEVIIIIIRWHAQR